MDSGDEDFKIICPGTTGVIFIEIERDVYDLAFLGKGSWTLGAGKDAVWEGGQTGKGGKTLRFDPLCHLVTGTGMDEVSAKTHGDKWGLLNLA